jgi:hypothetical protein
MVYFLPTNSLKFTDQGEVVLEVVAQPHRRLDAFALREIQQKVRYCLMKSSSLNKTKLIFRVFNTLYLLSPCFCLLVFSSGGGQSIRSV